MNRRVKQVVERCGRMCEECLQQSRAADSIEDSLYWLDRAAAWSARAFAVVEFRA